VARLFSAIELPAAVRTDLGARVAAIRDAGTGTELRWTAPASWHITIGFYGDREHPDRRGAWFRTQAASLGRARIRLRAGGRFPGVLWTGVTAKHDSDVAALRQLAAVLVDDAGPADPYDFVPHVTIARWRRGAAGSAAAAAAVAALAGYASEWWTVTEVVLFRSDPSPEGVTYTPLDRVALAGKQR
jgi:RNA 2',3'-cyclic 3'-phosphodiesterase